MGLFDRFQLPWRTERRTPILPGPDLQFDAEPVGLAVIDRPAPKAPVAVQQQIEEGLSLGTMSLDSDDYQYRRLTDGKKVHRRDLSPLAQDRMLEISWFLWEGNPFAKRLITLMKDLILGEGVEVNADDERLQEAIDKTWNHPVNQLSRRLGEFYQMNSLSGELILPAGVNPIDGRITLGFIEPYQVKDVIPFEGNALIPDEIVMKGESGSSEGKRYKVIRFNPASGMLEGEVFFHAINKLPNSLRGRSDLMALADWLDLYDQYMFSEVERLHLLSSFVWDYEITGAQSDKEVADKVKKLPRPKPGQVFGHNEKEKLTAKTPDLKATDRSEVARMLRVHIAGSYGFPLSYLGEVDSNRATIEGQNDILLKTPSARQKEFGQFINQVVQFGVQNAIQKSPALFRQLKPGWQVTMPEIAAKDIARVGGVLAQVATALDTSINNETMSKKTAIVIQSAIIKHLGVDIDPNTLADEIDSEAEERQARADDMQASMAAAAAAAGRNPNPPIPQGPPRRQLPPADPVEEGEFLDRLDDLNDTMNRMADRPIDVHIAQPAVHVAAPTVNIQPAAVTVEAPVSVNVPRGKVVKETVHKRGQAGLLESSVTTETPVEES